jgi:hypothetical protein
MLLITKKVTKKVQHPNPPDPKQPLVKRECTLKFNAVDPKSEDWIEDAVAICGGSSNLAACVFNYGLAAWLRQQETNKLGKVGELSKSFAKAIAGFTGMGLSPEQARTMILSNPDLAIKLTNETFEQFVDTTVDDFAAYQTDTNEQGVQTSRFPDVTRVGSDDSDESDESDK